MSKNRKMSTKTIVYCAVLVALSVAVNRIMAFMPEESTRFSIGPIFTFMAGMFFGPVAGGLVGFSSDFIGSFFTPFGYNFLFCVPPSLYGVFGGVFQKYLAKKLSFPRLLLAFAFPVVLGSVLWQSAALAFAYDLPFLLKLTTRSMQFSVTLLLDVLLIMLLDRTKVFKHIGVWPPVKNSAGTKVETCKIG